MTTTPPPAISEAREALDKLKAELEGINRDEELTALSAAFNLAESQALEIERLKAKIEELNAEAKIIEESHADDMRMIDRIADIICLPQDQELSTTAFELWSSEQTAERDSLTAQVAGLTGQSGDAHYCGLPMSKNPHPDAGKLDGLCEHGYVYECVPCMSKSRHAWVERAQKAEAECDRLKAALESAEKVRRQKSDLLNLSLQVLEPKGSELLNRLIDGGAVGFHASWGDEAHTLTGEQRAETLLRFMDAPSESLVFDDASRNALGESQ